MEIYNLISKKGIDLNNFGIRVIVKPLNELDDDFQEYFKTKAFTKYKPYMYVLKDIDTTLVLCVIMSKCIPFTIKYENVEDQPVTKLFNTTGSVLLWEAQLQHYKNDIKDGLIANSDYKFSDYIKDTKILFDEDERIALGCCDFIFFFRERSNFFVVKDVKVTTT